MKRLLVIAVLAVALAAPAGATAADPPVLAAAGDIACPSGAPKDATHCHDMETSDLVISRAPDAVAVLGDNQYENGTLAEFQSGFNTTWGRITAPVHPVPGNHEYQSDPLAAGYYTYFGTAAGDPAKGYYSWDLGDWHMVALNSDCADANACDGLPHVSSTEVTWLQDDLVAHPAQCTLAAWHHPLRGDGNGGDNPAVKPLWQALYASGADLVLNGHDHSYQRWAPMSPEGAADDDGPTQIVVGTGGEDLLAPGQQRLLDLVQDAAHFGVLFVTLHPSRADWEWRSEDGTVRDSGSTWCHRPQAQMTVTPAAPPATTPAAFDAGGSADHHGRALTAFAWDFGDGTAATGSQVPHAYAAPGTYTATLTVTNARGLQGRTRRTVTVGPAPPSPAPPGAPAAPDAPATADPDAAPGPNPEVLAPAAAALAPLRLFEAGMTRRAFRRGSSTAFRYRLSARARVRIVIQRRRGSRWTTVRTIVREAQAGPTRLPFEGRVRGRLPTPGSYRAQLSATDGSGRRSVTATVAFRIAPGA